MIKLEYFVKISIGRSYNFVISELMVSLFILFLVYGNVTVNHWTFLNLDLLIQIPITVVTDINDVDENQNEAVDDDKENQPVDGIFKISLN